MRVLFRADASVEIGTGHIMRCATLAKALRARGASVAFACRALPGDLRGWLQQQGYPVMTVPADLADGLFLTAEALSVWSELDSAPASPPAEVLLDWLVVDHYGLDARWEKAMRGQARQILVIDDLANRSHDCDVLLDQNIIHVEASPYADLVPAHCQQLLGPRFALLRPEFAALRQVLPQRRAPGIDGSPRLLIFFGGSDPTQECLKALEALLLLRTGEPPVPEWVAALQVDLVAGGSNPVFETLQARSQAFPNVRLHRQVTYMAALMQQADLSLGAGGTTTWERCCLGLPGVIIAVADNQVAISQNLAGHGVQVYLGESSSVTPQAIAEALRSLLGEPESQQVLSRLGQAGMALVDGLGVQRVVEIMCKVHL